MTSFVLPSKVLLNKQLIIMKKLIKLFLIIVAAFACSNSIIAQNTDCLGVTKLATDGVFTDGYIYKFTTTGTDVTVSFELLDSKAGLVAYIFTYNPDFTEVSATNAGGQKFTKTFSGQTIGSSFKVACKFAYAGGLVVTKIFTYVVGSSCSDIPADTESPTLFIVTKGSVTYHSVELLLNATDNSGTVLYEITNGTNKFVTTGVSGVQKSYNISGLTADSPYNFSVVAKDVSGNAATNSPVLLAATTATNTSTECSGSYTDAQQGEFTDGYNYTFTTSGTDVTVTFELLDNKTGVGAFFWTYNPDFAEAATTLISGKKFSKTFTGQALDAKFKVACKFAYTGGMSVTKTLTYTVGNTCGGTGGPDTEIPTFFSVTKGAVTGSSVELLLNASDNSGAVVYTITYGTTTINVIGNSGVLQSYIVTGLTPATGYSFSIVAKDANGNAAANNPIVVEATTDVALPGIAKIDYETVGQDWSWTLFENGDNAPSLYAVVANPNSEGINTSAHCAQYTVNANGAPWAGLWSSNIAPFTFSTDNCKVKVMVNKNVISNFDLKFENADGKVAFEKQVPNTVINQWEELTFDYTDQIGKAVTKIVFIPDFSSTRSIGSVNYWDNVTFNSNVVNGVNQQMVAKFSVYPNPVQDKLHINSELEIGQVIVRDLLGQQVKSITVHSLNKTIDLTGLASGNYFITVLQVNGELSTQKIVKL